jgi:hypothetical protein
MRRGAVLAGSAIAVISSVAVGHVAAAAPSGEPVVIVAHTELAAEEAAFESSIEGCTAGTVVNGDGGPHFTPWGGVFAGLKEFTCADGESGFTVNLTARFGGFGSTGTWRILDAWGVLSGAKGSGSLVGISTSETTIDDWYTGIIR